MRNVSEYNKYMFIVCLVFLPLCRYDELNFRCLSSVRQYSSSVPAFLIDRPKFFVSHCLRRLPPAVQIIPQENIVSSADGVYAVKSVDSEDTVYSVRLCDEQHGGKLPSCNCPDWSRHCLPCKHLLAVIVQCSGAGGWDSLPDFYRSFPLFNIDPDIMQLNSSNSTCSSTVCTPQSHSQASETAAVTSASDSVEPTDVESHPPVEQLQSKLRQALAGIRSCTYAISDVQFLETSLEAVTQLLHDCEAKCSSAVHRASFWRNRRIVKRSVAGVGLRRYLAATRAKRRCQKAKKQLVMSTSNQPSSPPTAIESTSIQTMVQRYMVLVFLFHKVTYTMSQ